MNEQEMREEIERLRRELADVTKSRERLRDWLCQVLDFQPLTDQEVEEMMSRPPKQVDVLLRELLPPDLHHLIDDKKEASEDPKVPAHA